MPAAPHPDHRRPTYPGPVVSLLRLSARARLLGAAGLSGLLWWAVLGVIG